jgi:hypothetical protein
VGEGAVMMMTMTIDDDSDDDVVVPAPIRLGTYSVMTVRE